MRATACAIVLLLLLSIASRAAPPVDEGGIYLELAGRAHPDVVGGDIGIMGFVNPYVTMRGSLSLLASEPLEDLFTGLNIGAYAHFPWRVSPYVGIGAFLGYSKEEVLADRDGIDNDNDDFIDEGGEEDTIVDDVTSSLYPEAGLFGWVTENTRLSISARYHFSSEGRDADDWVYSVGAAFRF